MRAVRQRLCRVRCALAVVSLVGKAMEALLTGIVVVAVATYILDDTRRLQEAVAQQEAADQLPVHSSQYQEGCRDQDLLHPSPPETCPQRNHVHPFCDIAEPTGAFACTLSHRALFPAHEAPAPQVPLPKATARANRSHNQCAPYPATALAEGPQL